MTGWTTLGRWTDHGPDACGVILADSLGRIALQLRDDLEGVNGPGHWGFFGGEREAGETLEAAAIREMEEETTLRFSAGELSPFARTQSGLGTRIWMFTTARRFMPAEITVREGAGFGFLTADQILRGPSLESTALIAAHYLSHNGN